MTPRDMRKGDRVRVGDAYGTLQARQNKTGGMGLDVLFDDVEDGVSCICEPEDVVFVSRPEKKPGLVSVLRSQLRASEAERERLRREVETYDRALQKFKDWVCERMYYTASVDVQAAYKLAFAKMEHITRTVPSAAVEYLEKKEKADE